jgi:hypothetical protein
MASQHIQDDEVATSSSRLHLTTPGSRFRHLSRSPHPYHRRGTKLLEGDSGSTGNEDSFQQTPVWRRTPRTSSDSGTEADDESTGLLKGLPAPPTRPRKGLRGIQEHDASPDSGSAQDQPWLLRRKTSQNSSQGPVDKVEVGVVEALNKISRRRKIGFLRRLFEALLLLGVGSIVTLGNGVRIAVKHWNRGGWNLPN